MERNRIIPTVSTDTTVAANPIQTHLLRTTATLDKYTPWCNVYPDRVKASDCSVTL